MSLEYAILGFLEDEPVTGYDLKKVFDRSIVHFWAADQSQIYRTLSLLHKQGWVRKEIVPQEQRPTRKVYHITEEGRAALRAWLATPLPADTPRIPWLIQLFFAGQIEDAEVLRVLESKAASLRAKLARYTRVLAEAEAHIGEEASPRDKFFWLSTLDYGVVTAEAQLAWLEQVIERVRQGAWAA
ncbi:MAG: PadR family transcriptional regulator [Anaerolineales bacterium]